MIAAVKIRFAFFVALIAAFSCFVATPLSQADDNLVDFRTEIVPVLTKLGCNAGACHGSAAGRGGFKLSLYGGQPKDDYEAIALQGRGRRINRSKTELSLILRKPSLELDHGGDFRFDLDDPAGQLLSKWISQGANFDNHRKLERIEVNSKTIRVSKPSDSYPLKFSATYSDQQTVDVTGWVVVTTGDPSSVSVDEETNRITVHRSGRHILIARFLDEVFPIEVILPFAKQNDSSETVVSEERQGFVEQRINEKLSLLGIQPAATCDDSTFIRRVTLDLTGRLPTVDAVTDFVNDNSPLKRIQAIDVLLNSEAYVDYWTYRFATQLRIRSLGNDKTSFKIYHGWLREQVASNRPWSQICQELLNAKGDSHLAGPPSFYRTAPDARLQSEFITEAILGVKLRCANCHNHPLDHWTQDDYHGLASVFATVKQSRVVSLNPKGKNIHARTGLPAIPKIPGGDYIDPNSDEDLRSSFSDWVLEEENPYFAKAIVNRIWKALMGRGLVEPVDDLRSTNPATHPVLLEELAQDFVDSEFDIQDTIRLICQSDAYQRKLVVGDNEYARTFYASASLRPLPPEVLADAICDLTGVANSYNGYKKGTRAVQLPDPKIPSVALDVLGRCSREESCEAEKADGATGGLAQQLHLLNGNLINQKLGANEGLVHLYMSQNTSPEKIVKEIYLMAYGRSPSADEIKYWCDKLNFQSDVSERREKIEDFLWSTLNSREFKTNH